MNPLSGRLKKFFLLFGLTVLLYTVARVEFLVWNYGQFKNRAISEIFWAFFVGVRFDLSAVAYLSLVPLLASFVPWHKLKITLQRQNFFQWLLYVSIQVPLVILSLVDTAYVDFVGRRFTWDTLFLWGEVQGKLWSFLAPFLGLFIVNSVLVVFYMWLAWKIIAPKNYSLDLSPEVESILLPRPFYKVVLVGAVQILGALIFVVLAARGGFQKKPISFVHANVFDVPVLNNLVLNSTFTVLKSYGEPALGKEKYFSSEADLIQHLNGGSSERSVWSVADKNIPIKNVVVIMLESFGTEYTAVGGVPSYTPFLDELSKNSLFFPNAWANGRRSIEGVAAVMAGIPALMSEPFISSQFASNYFLGLGTLLGQNGFETAFFHGGNNGTMYFDSFMKSAGVEKYFGANEYPRKEDHDGVWGIWDEPFLSWSIDQMNEFRSPFFASIFTLSSHQPFQVPKMYVKDFPEGPIPILKAVRYADFSLRKFFEKAEKQTWFNETLFIITADHASMHFRPAYESEAGNYKIPLLFYQNGRVWPSVDLQQPVSQVDILPTLMEVLDISEPMKNLLGRSVFVPGERATVNFIDGRYIITTSKDWMVWSPIAGTELNKNPKLYLISDIAGKNPLSDADRIQYLQTKIKAHIQYFSRGMWDNRLYYRAGN